MRVIRLTIAADLPGLILALHLGICYATHLLVGAAVAFLAPTSHAYTIQQRHVLSRDGRSEGGGEVGRPKEKCVGKAIPQYTGAGRDLNPK